MQSKADKENFAKFRKRYPGWDIVRLEDYSMKFVAPIPVVNIKPVKRIIYVDRI